MVVYVQLYVYTIPKLLTALSKVQFVIISFEHHLHIKRNQVVNLMLYRLIPKEIKDDPEQAIFGLDLWPFDRTV